MLPSDGHHQSLHMFRIHITSETSLIRQPHCLVIARKSKHKSQWHGKRQFSTWEVSGKVGPEKNINQINIGSILLTSELRFVADRVDDHLRYWVLWDTLSIVDEDPMQRDRDSGAANPDPFRATAGAEAGALGRTE